jgi:hypothetical protein
MSLNLIAVIVINVIINVIVRAAAPTIAAQSDAATVIDRAIAAAGGVETLSRYPVLSWNGAATIHAGDRVVNIVGTWTLEPPDRAVVRTRRADQPSASPRALIVEGTQGWTMVGDTRTPLTAEMLAAERDAFYLYWLMRIVPLTDPDMRLEAVPRATEGLDGVRVRRASRPDVDLFFDESGRLRRLSLVTMDATTGTRRRQNIRLEGESVDNGVRWFKTLVIHWEDRPYFELAISDFQARRTPGNPERGTRNQVPRSMR